MYGNHTYEDRWKNRKSSTNESVSRNKEDTYLECVKTLPPDEKHKVKLAKDFERVRNYWTRPQQMHAINMVIKELEEEERNVKTKPLFSHS